MGIECSSRVMIVDKHPVVCSGLSQNLSEAGYIVVACARDCMEASRLIEGGGIDVVILDVDVPGGDGIELVEKYSSLKREVCFLVFSAQNERFYASRSRAAGALGFVSKRSGVSSIVRAVEAVSSGYYYFQNEIEVFGEERVTDGQLILSLSKIEFSVFEGVVKGFSNKDVALKIGASKQSVSAYKSRVYKKLRVENMFELVSLAKRSGVI